MMREQYWGLFWSTGMPTAWLMSRGGSGADAGLRVEGPWGLSGPPTGVEPVAPEDIPQSPKGPI